MKKIFTLCAATMLGLTVMADDFNLYYEATSEATSTKIDAVSNLKKLVFENGNLVVERVDGSKTTLSLADLKSLYFFTANGVVGIEGVKADKQQAKETSESEVYDLMGRKLNKAPEDLPKGLYIVDGKKTLIK